MKKIIFTLSFAALFTLTSKAQDNSAKSTNDQAPKVEAVNADGTVATPEKTTAEPSVKKEEAKPAKKSGTRMAINEKGMPGNSAKKTEKKEEKNPAPAKRD